MTKLYIPYHRFHSSSFEKKIITIWQVLTIMSHKIDQLMQIFKAQHTNWQILEGCWTILTHRSIETSLQPLDMVPLWGKVFKFCDEITETSLPLAVGDLVGQGGRQPGWILLNANVTQFKLYKDTNFKEESMLGVQRFFEQMKKETTCIGGSGLRIWCCRP